MEDLFEAYLAVYEANKAEVHLNMSDEDKQKRRNIRWADNTHGIDKDNTIMIRDPDTVKLVNKIRVSRHKKSPSLDRERTAGTKMNTYLDRQADKKGLQNKLQKAFSLTENVEYILDILISEGYVDNYDSAANILEVMSDEWLVGILSEAPYQILEEAYKLPNKKIKLRTVYHGTSVPNVKNIRKTGFKAGTRFNQDKPIVQGERIYVTTDKKRAEAYANEAGPLKHGYEVDNDQNTHKRSPIGAEQVTRDVSRLNSNGRPTLKNVNAVGRVLNFITRRNKPKVLKLAMGSHVGSKSPLIPSKNERPDEHTISAKQADIGLRNSKIRDRMRRGTIPRRT